MTEFMEFDDQKVEENNGVTFNTSMVSADLIILSDTVADHAEFLRRGANPRGGWTNVLFGKVFAKDCMRIK